jgi:tetratricopeptide (TPR) repeat protein
LAYASRGLAYASLGSFNQPIRDCDKAIELGLQDASVYASRGLAYAGLSDFNRAIRDYDKAIDMNQKGSWVFAPRAFAYASLGNFTQAIKDFNKAIELDPKDAWSYASRGLAYAGLSDFNRAIRDYDRAIELDPEYAEAYNLRGLTYYKLVSYDKAIRDFDRATKLDPELASAHNNMAWLLATVPEPKYRNGKKAIKYAEKAVSLVSMSALFYNTLAAAYAEAHYFEKAVLMESIAYDIYEPAHSEDKLRDIYRQLIEVYKNRKTYVEQRYPKGTNKKRNQNASR